MPNLIRISYLVADVLVTAEMYRFAVEARHTSFLPFVISLDGALGKEAVLILRHIADRLAGACNWGKNYGDVF